MKKNIADEMPEPPNGTYLVIAEGSGPPHVIWHDDDQASRAHRDERWFEDPDLAPLGWREVMKYADKVYDVTSEPIRTRSR